MLQITGTEDLHFWKIRSCCLASSSWNFRVNFEKSTLISLQKSSCRIAGAGAQGGRRCSRTLPMALAPHQCSRGTDCMGSHSLSVFFSLPTGAFLKSVSWPSQGNGNMHCCYNRLLLVHLQICVCARKMPRLRYKNYSLNEALSQNISLYWHVTLSSLTSSL